VRHAAAAVNAIAAAHRALDSDPPDAVGVQVAAATAAAAAAAALLPAALPPQREGAECARAHSLDDSASPLDVASEAAGGPMQRRTSLLCLAADAQVAQASAHLNGHGKVKDEETRAEPADETLLHFASSALPPIPRRTLQVQAATGD
jgi:hypothetical protein